MFKKLIYGFLGLIVISIILGNMGGSNISNLTPEEKKSKINAKYNEVSKLPKSKYRSNYYGYKELNKLDPENKLFKTKMNYYKNFVDLEFDCGSTAYSVSKNKLKFPDTFEQLDVKRHWLIEDKIKTRINFIGKNAFGVPVKHTALFECSYKNNKMLYTMLEFRQQ